MTLRPAPLETLAGGRRRANGARANGARANEAGANGARANGAALMGLVCRMTEITTIVARHGSNFSQSAEEAFARGSATQG